MRKQLTNKILQQLYNPHEKNFVKQLKKIDELNEVIDEFTKKFFCKKSGNKKTKGKK